MANKGGGSINFVVVICIFAIVAAVVMVVINPPRQFAQARNTQREANVSAILNAVGERLADHRGIFEDETGNCTATLPSSDTTISKAAFDLRPCIVPTYISEIPLDPASGENTCTDSTCSSGSYMTGYTIRQDADTMRITICAPEHEEVALDESEKFCLTR